MIALILVAAMCGAEPAKELTPKQKREAAEKAITDKMAPLAKELAEAKVIFEATKAAPVTGKSSRSGRIGNAVVMKSFRTAESKAATLAELAKPISDLTAKLKSLKDELEALKKPPKPEPPKAPEKPPEKKP